MAQVAPEAEKEQPPEPSDLELQLPQVPAPDCATLEQVSSAQGNDGQVQKPAVNGLRDGADAGKLQDTAKDNMSNSLFGVAQTKTKASASVSRLRSSVGKDPKVTRTEAHRMVVTKEGRVKMMHTSCEKTTWDKVECETQQVKKVYNPIELVTSAGKAKAIGLDDTGCRARDFQVAIEFDVVEVLAVEGKEQIEVPVRRIGDLSGRLECRYVLQNGNLLTKFFEMINPKSGLVVFEEGEATTTITVPIVDDPTWNVEGVYFVELDPESLSTTGPKATLGENLKMGVYTLNDESFPSGVASTASIAQFVRGFLVHNYHELPKETLWGCIYMIYPAIHYFLGAKILEILLNCGVNPKLLNSPDKQCVTFGIEYDVSTHPDRILFILASLQLALFLLKHTVKTRYRKLGLGGKAIRILRTNMFSTMLQLSPEALEAFDAGDVPKALDTQVEAAIKGVWLPAFELFDSLLQLVVKCGLTIQIAVVSKKLPTSALLVIIFSCPVMIVIMVIVMWIRAKPQLERHRSALLADDNWSAFVTMAETNTPTILNYQQGHTMAETFHAAHARFNKTSAAAAGYSAQSIELLKGGFALVFALVVVIGGRSAQQGGLSLGGFVVILNAVKNFGASLSSMGVTVNTMVIGTAAVQKLADILNKETRRHRRLRRMRDGGAGWTGTLSHQVSSNDDCNICLTNVSYEYPGTGLSIPSAVPLLNLTIASGNLVCVPTSVVNSKLGIQTLFKLVSRELIPDAGSIGWPARWRVIYLPVIPLLFDGTLMYNLSFSDRCPDVQAVWQVCRGLGLSKELIEDADFDVGNQGHSLKYSDRLIICIARAILHQVDVMLISSALDVIGEDGAKQILKYLNAYVHNRGVDEVYSQNGENGDKLPRELRHVKTVIYSTKFNVLEDMANLLIHAQ